MDTLQRTVKILADAESGLATLASEAAKGHDYEAAGRLIDLARDVKNLATKVSAQLDTNTRELTQAPNVAHTGKTVASPTLSAKSRTRKGEYPKFLREGDNLLKIGWSRSERSEYEHKSPKKIISLLAGSISKTGANGRRFSMDKVLPLLDPDDGNRIPDYQVYLCLAWLKGLGFLTQHGRQGYSLSTRAPIEPLIETHWNALPTR
jgi:hypothetical protein